MAPWERSEAAAMGPRDLLTDWRCERLIRRTLRGVARQRVVLDLQPGNVWVVELSLDESESEIRGALRTCHMHGWLDPMFAGEAINSRRLQNGVPTDRTSRSPMCRVTDCGWQVLRRTHTCVLVGAFLSLVAAV